MPGEERLELPCSVRSTQGSDIVEVVIYFAERYREGGVVEVVMRQGSRGTRRSGPGVEARGSRRWQRGCRS